MNDITLKAIGYGTPPLCILLGFSAYTSGKLTDILFGNSGDMMTLGIILMAFGLIMGALEIFAKFR